jgi:hypothetical protein
MLVSVKTQFPARSGLLSFYNEPYKDMRPEPAVIFFNTLEEDRWPAGNGLLFYFKGRPVAGGEYKMCL